MWDFVEGMAAILPVACLLRPFCAANFYITGEVAGRLYYILPNKVTKWWQQDFVLPNPRSEVDDPY